MVYLLLDWVVRRSGPDCLKGEGGYSIKLPWIYITALVESGMVEKMFKSRSEVSSEMLSQ